MLGVNRQVSYNRTDCFMLCVAINNRNSLESVRKWRTEIKTVCKDIPIILVGTKSDLRADSANPISKQELQQKVKDEGLQGFCETSSKNWQDHNVSAAFMKAIRAGYYNKYPDEMLDGDQ